VEAVPGKTIIPAEFQESSADDADEKERTLCNLRAIFSSFIS
jgi:hypothetical protein